jgi:hypothetical protein
MTASFTVLHTFVKQVWPTGPDHLLYLAGIRKIDLNITPVLLSGYLHQIIGLLKHPSRIQCENIYFIRKRRYNMGNNLILGAQTGRKGYPTFIFLRKPG